MNWKMKTGISICWILKYWMYNFPFIVKKTKIYTFNPCHQITKNFQSNTSQNILWEVFTPKHKASVASFVLWSLSHPALSALAPNTLKKLGTPEERCGYYSTRSTGIHCWLSSLSFNFLNYSLLHNHYHYVTSC